MTYTKAYSRQHDEFVADALAAVSGSTAIDATKRADAVLANIFDPTRTTVDSAVRLTNGTIASGQTGYSISDFMRIEPLSSIATLKVLFGSGSYGIAFYDAAQTFISSVAGLAAAGNTATPANAVFVRVTVLTSLIFQTHIVRGATAPTTFLAFEKLNTFTVRGAFIDRMDDLFGHVPNLFVTASLTDGYYLNTGTGALVANASYFTTNPMPVTPGGSYVANKTTPGGTGYVWTDMNGSYLSGGTLTAGTAVTAPVGAAYLRAAYLTSSTEPRFGSTSATKLTLMVVEGTSLPATFRAGGYADVWQASEAGAKAANGRDYARVNLYDPATITLNTVIDRFGAVTGSAGYVLFDQVAVSPGKGLALNCDSVPGSSSFGWNWYDIDGNRLGSSTASVTADITSGSATINVTALGSMGPLTKGLPVNNANFPTGTYVVSVPATGPGTTGNYVLSANATGTAAGATITGGGALGKIAVYPPVGPVAFGRFFAPSSARYDLVITDEDITGAINAPTNRYSASGYVGIQDAMRNLPFARQDVAFIGDSIMQDNTGSNAYQSGLENWLRANGLIYGGGSGRKVRETLNGITPGTYTRGSASAYVSGDFATVALTYSNAGTNDFGVYGGGAWVGQRNIGTVSDTWTPTQVTATVSGSVMTVSAVASGTLAVGMPVASPTMPYGTVISSFGTGTGGTGTYNLSNSVTIGSSTTIYGGTFYGDLYDVNIRKLQTWNPAMTIALSTPLPRFDNSATGNPTNSFGETLQQYADAVLAFGARYSLSVFDLFRESGINTANSATYLPDGLHPNVLYYQTRMVPKIGKWLNSL